MKRFSYDRLMHACMGGWMAAPRHHNRPTTRRRNTTTEAALPLLRHRSNLPRISGDRAGRIDGQRRPGEKRRAPIVPRAINTDHSGHEYKYRLGINRKIQWPLYLCPESQVLQRDNRTNERKSTSSTSFSSAGTSRLSSLPPALSVLGLLGLNHKTKTHHTPTQNE